MIGFILGYIIAKVLTRDSEKSTYKPLVTASTLSCGEISATPIEVKLGSWVEVL